MVISDKAKEATASGATDAPQYRAAARNMRRPEDKMVIRMATLNVGTLSGRSAEVVDFMKRRSVGFCVYRKRSGSPIEQGWLVMGSK